MEEEDDDDTPGGTSEDSDTTEGADSIHDDDDDSDDMEESSVKSQSTSPAKLENDEEPLAPHKSPPSPLRDVEQCDVSKEAVIIACEKKAIMDQKAMVYQMAIVDPKVMVDKGMATLMSTADVEYLLGDTPPLYR